MTVIEAGLHARIAGTAVSSTLTKPIRSIPVTNGNERAGAGEEERKRVREREREREREEGEREEREI